MASSRLSVGYQQGVGGIKGADVLAAKLANFSDKTKALLRDALEQGADELVDDMRAIAPVSSLDPHPGELRDSIHKEDGRNELSVYVVADAKAEDGEFYGPHVEFGHKAKGGAHVQAEPFFFPSVRVAKKKISSRVSRAMTAAIKQEVAGQPSAGEGDE